MARAAGHATYAWCALSSDDAGENRALASNDPDRRGRRSTVGGSMDWIGPNRFLKNTPCKAAELIGTETRRIDGWNARLTPLGRDRIVRRVQGAGGRRRPSAKVQASACGRFVSGLSVIVAKDWQGCKIAHPGRIGCGGRRIEEIERLRRQRWTGKQIAAQVGVSPPTVSRSLEPAEPVRRYERENRVSSSTPTSRSSAALDRGASHHRPTNWRGPSPPRHRLGVRPYLH
jgi:hypothetical protein